MSAAQAEVSKGAEVCEAVEEGSVKLFGQLVRTAVNVALLPVEIAKDVVTAPIKVMTDDAESIGEHTKERIETLKDEAGEE